LFKRLIEWLLSKLFPLREEHLSEEATMHGKSIDWKAAKMKESELYYGGYDGTIQNEEERR